MLTTGLVGWALPLPCPLEALFAVALATGAAAAPALGARAAAAAAAGMAGRCCATLGADAALEVATGCWIAEAPDSAALAAACAAAEGTGRAVLLAGCNLPVITALLLGEPKPTRAALAGCCCPEDTGSHKLRSGAAADAVLVAAGLSVAGAPVDGGCEIAGKPAAAGVLVAGSAEKPRRGLEPAAALSRTAAVLVAMSTPAANATGCAAAVCTAAAAAGLSAWPERGPNLKPVGGTVETEGPDAATLLNACCIAAAPSVCPEAEAKAGGALLGAWKASNPEVTAQAELTDAGTTAPDAGWLVDSCCASPAGWEIAVRAIGRLRGKYAGHAEGAV